MKSIMLILAFVSTAAFAHPGGHSLTCKSAAQSGSKQKVQFSLARSNGVGWYPPSYEVTIDGKKYEFKTEDEMQSYGSTSHNSPLGLIEVTADNSDDKTAKVKSYFSVVAIPSTVKATDGSGHLVKWSFKDQKDQDGCYDSNGKATFKAIFSGMIQQDNVTVDMQIMDCTLDYNSGMAC